MKYEYLIHYIIHVLVLTFKYIIPKRLGNGHSMHSCQVALVVSNSLWLYGLETVSVLCLWDSPGKNTGVSYHALLKGIFLTQGLNCLLFPALAGGFLTASATWEAQEMVMES